METRIHSFGSSGIEILWGRESDYEGLVLFMPDDPIDPITDPPVDPVDPPNDPPVDPPAPAPSIEDDDPLEEETFRTVKKFNRAVKKSREPNQGDPPTPAPAPAPDPAPAPSPDPPAPAAKGRGFLDPFRKRTR